ncbi:16S rRNA (uracil(1498)-N(3))-methyltransferase [Bacillus timonensis]|nr:16S rRNA (uracil(1498)-N(3))-methyltransferase [Bacillus timonensis]
MQRYFIPRFIDQSIEISGDDFHHISRVMRMEAGDNIICCDATGKTARVEITKITNESIFASVVEWIENSSEMPVKITIASGLPKGDKLEYVFQKGTELGAFEFVPFIAARSIVKWDEKKGAKKVDRWNKIVKEAAEQSHRNILPVVRTPVTFKQLISMSEPFDHKVIAYEEDAKIGEKSNLARTIKQITTDQTMLVVIGPEGGLSENEVRLLQNAGFVSCGFGPRILRTETAPLYVLSAVSYHLELMR